METMPDSLTVGEAAALLGVTVRTLHHWDELGLARPSSRSTAGYRLYGTDDLERLRRVLVYRELDLELEAIRALLDDPATDTVAALRAQQEQLTERIERLQALSGDLDRMIRAHEHGLLLDADEQQAILGPGWDPQWGAQAAERYGRTAQWQQYAERSAARGPDAWRAVAAATSAFEAELSRAMATGTAPGSAEANVLAARHREVFGAFFPITIGMQVLLGRRYETEPGFAAHYDAIRPGLASWFRRVIDAAARAEGVDPDTATWA
jgi:DNA-binding transcriptional MerR regulator